MTVEAKLVLEQLFSMLEKSGMELFGLDNINLPQILQLLSKVMSEWRKSVTLETAERMIGLMEIYKHL